VLTLQTGETDIQANDVIGAINFQAPDEGTGTDAILVSAGIEAVSEGDFAADSNATKLSFKTGASEAASEKMSLSSAGNLVISGDLTVSGDDITMGTNTSGHIMVADGTNFNPVAVSGDVTIAANGAVTIANNAIETAMIADNQVSAAKLTANTGLCNASATISNGGGTVSASSNNTNIASMADNGTGDFTATFTSNMSGTDFAAVVSAIDDDGTNRNIGETIVQARTTSTVQIKTFRPSASENSARAAFDNDAIALAIFD
jgi:hypothetical protein